MGVGHVSRMPGLQPVGSPQAGASMATEHDREVAEAVLQEGLPHVPRSLKVRLLGLVEEVPTSLAA